MNMKIYVLYGLCVKNVMEYFRNTDIRILNKNFHFK